MRTTLKPGFELAPQRDPLVADAVIGALMSLLYRELTEHGPEQLPRVAPLGTYMVLAPFIGAEAACEVANGDGRLPSV